jgi:GT2 family glycosyltransferase
VIESITWPAPVQDARGSGAPVPDLSIVIVSWNVREHLLNCLRAICSPTTGDLPSLEVIVVDNASRDGSADAASKFPVTVIRNNRNLGYGQANNAGLRAAGGRFLMVLNPDTIPQHRSLKKLVEFAEHYPKAGIVAPRLLNRDSTVQTAAFKFPTLPMALLDLFPPPRFLPGRLRLRLLRSGLNGRYPAEGERTHPFKIDHPLGAAFLLRREAYEQCGGFDESIFMYSEEIDLALRYAASGWESWQVPQAEIVHLGGQSTRQVADDMFVELWRSRLLIYDRYYTPLSRLLLRLLLILAMLRDIGMATVSHLFGGAHAQARRRIRRASAILRLAVGR